MTRQSSNVRPWYFGPLVGLVLGVVIGLVIGWGIWPVSYKNTLPQDLRPAERQYYLTMVAESYAASGDLQTARDRLASWPQADLAKSLADLQENLINTNAKLAGDVQVLAQALNLTLATPEAPVTPPQPAQSTASTGSSLKSILTTLLWIILILVGLGALIYLFRRWRAARGEQATGGFPGPSGSGRPVQPADRLQGEGGVGAPGQPLAGTRGVLDESGLTSSAGGQLEGESDLMFYEVEPTRGDVAPTLAPAHEEPRRPSAAPSQAVTTGTAPLPSASTVSAPSLVKLSEEVAVYQMGEPDYDEAFDINDPVAGYLGECGLQSNELVGRNRDQAVALRVWLYDQRDSSTQLKVLMSEGAYRDTALRSQQAGGNEVLQVRQGTEFELESHDLLLRGRVEKIDYADQEPYRGVFAELQVRMQVYRKVGG